MKPQKQIFFFLTAPNSFAGGIGFGTDFSGKGITAAVEEGLHGFSALPYYFSDALIVGIRSPSLGSALSGYRCPCDRIT
jgi:hypothetical protein